GLLSLWQRLYSPYKIFFSQGKHPLKSRIVVCVSFVICLSAMTFAVPGAVHCGKLLDVRSGRMLTDQVVVFDGGVITAIGTAASTPVPAGVKVVDLSNGTCMPGFIDVHTN